MSQTTVKTGATAPKTAGKPASAMDKLAKLNPALAAALYGGTPMESVFEQETHTQKSYIKISRPCQIRCTVVKARQTDSFTADENGTQKEVVGEWLTPTPQVLVMFSDTNSPQYNTHFFHLMGYVLYEEVEAALKAVNQKPEDHAITKGSRGYALRPNEDGIIDRIPDATKTAQCLDMFSRFATAVGLDKLKISDVVDNLNEAIDNDTPMSLVVAFDYGKEYINRDGTKGQSIEAIKFLQDYKVTEEDKTAPSAKAAKPAKAAEVIDEDFDTDEESDDNKPF